MKLYLKQKVFSWRDRFRIYDANENEMFSAEGELLSFGKKLHLFNSRGEEMSFIHQKVMSFLPRYFISINGEDVAEVVKKFTFFTHEYVINGPGWLVTGDFFAHEYSVECGGRLIASVSKQWLTWGDTYEINITDSADTVMVLSVVLVIDAIMAQQSAASVSASTGD